MTNTINLKKQQLFWFEPSKSEAISPQITAGRVWVTMAGCQKDFIVGAGEYLPNSDQQILVEALSDEVVIDMVELTL